MKIKKFLALLLAAIMLCGLFAVVPVSAAKADVHSIFEAQNPEEHPGWWQTSTVDGYDGRISVNPTYKVSTKQTYDLKEYGIVINNLTGSAYPHRLMVTIAPEQFISAVDVNRYYDPANGVFTLGMSPHSSGVRLTAGNNVITDGTNSFKDISLSDTYVISFSKQTAYDENNFETSSYSLRVNGHVVVSTDSESWLAQLIDSESFSKSYVTFCTTDYHEFNADVTPLNYFTATDGYSSGTVTGLGTDGYTALGLHTRAAATSEPEDFTKRAFSFRPTGWGSQTTYGFAHQITFATERIGVTRPASDENTLCITLSPDHTTLAKRRIAISTTAGSVGNVHGQVNSSTVQCIELKSLQNSCFIGVDENNANIYSDVEQYDFSFVETSASGAETKTWALVVNGQYYTGDQINAFCNSGAVNNAYVSLSSAHSGSAAAKVIDGKVGFAHAATTQCTTTEDETGATAFTLYAASSKALMSTKKVNLLETTLELDDLVVGTSNTVFEIGFANKYYAGRGTTTGADGILSFDFWTKADGLAIAKASGNYLSGTSEPYASDNNYKINFVKEDDGSYAMYVNDKKVASNEITAFCENYGTEAYVYMYVYAGSGKVTPKFTDINTGFEVSVDGEARTQGTKIKNVASNSTVTDMKSQVVISEYYDYNVVAVDGTVRAADAAVASGDKLTITYRGKTVAEELYDIIVLGDTDGDGAVTSNDIINIKKQLLGISVEDIYSDALNACYDANINVLDFIYASKAVIA